MRFAHYLRRAYIYGGREEGEVDKGKTKGEGDKRRGKGEEEM